MMTNDKEDKLVLSRAEDALRIAERSYSVRAVGFLNPHQRSLIMKNIYPDADMKASFEGGYEDAERKMLVFLPEYLDETSLYEEYSPIVCLRATYFEGDTLSHRDFLGALMGAGIARETVGDICTGKGSCDFFVTAEIAPYILQNFTSAGRTKLHLERIPLAEAAIGEPEVKEIRDTVASLRLDSIISSGFRIGRSLAAQHITAGKAAIDGLPCEKPDKAVSEGAKISVRGLGKIKLITINGQTKKGRIGITIHRYV